MPEQYRMSDGFYTPVSVMGALCCNRCGALVYRPDAVPLGDLLPRDLHDDFHGQLDELRHDLRRREEWEAEHAEREG